MSAIRPRVSATTAPIPAALDTVTRSAHIRSAAPASSARPQQVAGSAAYRSSAIPRTPTTESGSPGVNRPLGDDVAIVLNVAAPEMRSWPPRGLRAALSTDTRIGPPTSAAGMVSTAPSSASSCRGSRGRRSNEWRRRFSMASGIRCDSTTLSHHKRTRTPSPARSASRGRWAPGLVSGGTTAGRERSPCRDPQTSSPGVIDRRHTVTPWGSTLPADRNDLDLRRAPGRGVSLLVDDATRSHRVDSQLNLRY